MEKAEKIQVLEEEIEHLQDKVNRLLLKISELKGAIQKLEKKAEPKTPTDEERHSQARKAREDFDDRLEKFKALPGETKLSLLNRFNS